MIHFPIVELTCCSRCTSGTAGNAYELVSFNPLNKEDAKVHIYGMETEGGVEYWHYRLDIGDFYLTTDWTLETFTSLQTGHWRLLPHYLSLIHI